MKFNDKGTSVRQLQRALIKSGYELPRFGADSHLGEESWEALQDFALDNEYVWAPEISDTLISSMLKDMEERDSPVLDDLSSTTVYDLREDPITMKGRNKLRMRGAEPVRRASTAVNGIVIHQTGIEYGVDRWKLKEAKGDKQLAIARRAKDIAAHAVSFGGFYSQVYPLSYYVYQAQALNRRTLGLEIEGVYPGLMDDPDTLEREDLLSLWKGIPTVFTKQREKSAKAALRYLFEEGRRLNMPIKYIYAHRQSAQMRRSDPGEEIWRKIVLDYAVPVLGLETRPGLTIGTGRSIPEDWDSEGYGPY